jgi:hypothetical protein
VTAQSCWSCGRCAHENWWEAQFCEQCGQRRHAADQALSAAAPEVGGAGGAERDEATARRLRREEERAAWRERGDERVRLRFVHLSERIRASLTPQTYREILDNRANPITHMIIAFLAWGIFRTFGYLPLMLLLRGLAFLMGPSGLFVVMVCTYVYSRHQPVIDARVRRLRQRSQAFRRAASSAAGTMELARRGLEGLVRHKLAAWPGGVETTEEPADDELWDLPEAPPTSPP